MCQYILVFRALIRLRYESGNLEMKHYMYFRRLVRLLYREIEELDRVIYQKSSKKREKSSQESKNNN